MEVMNKFNVGDVVKITGDSVLGYLSIGTECYIKSVSNNEGQYVACVVDKVFNTTDYVYCSRLELMQLATIKTLLTVETRNTFSEDFIEHLSTVIQQFYDKYLQ